MDNESSVGLLLEIIFCKQATRVEEKIARNPSISTALLSEDFILSLKKVLRVRRLVVLHRWRNFFDSCFDKMLSSYDMYLRFVMFACFSEHDCYNSVFESFISVCAVVKLLCDETLQKTELDFSDLTSDVIMVFYRCQMNQVFCRPHLGFEGFVKYINGHKYLKWKSNKNYSALPDEATVAFDYIPKEFEEKIKKEVKREGVVEKETNSDEIATNDYISKLAEGILSITLAKLPNLPTRNILMQRVMAYRKSKLIRNTEEKRGPEATEKSYDIDISQPGCSSLNSEYKTNYNPEPQDKTECYEDIIQAVISQNQRKGTCSENSNSQTPKADEIIENLNDMIESLLKVFDK